MPAEIEVREVGMRDGLQSIKTIMPTADKKAWCKAEFLAGVREIEVASLVPPKLLPQFADADEIVADALGHEGLVVAVLVPNLKGAERGIALRVDKLNYVLSVSESHNRSNVRRSTQESVDDFRRIIELRDGLPKDKRPRVAAGLSTAFGCTIEGAVSEERVLSLAVELAAAGADEIVLADTVGYGNPRAIKRVFTAAIAELKDVPVAAHFHDTRGLGLANVLAAIDAGVRAFDASLGGLGGCPYAPGATGNIVMEDLVFLCEAMGLSTGVDISRLMQVREIVARGIPGETLLGDVSKAGLPMNFGVAA